MAAAHMLRMLSFFVGATILLSDFCWVKADDNDFGISLDDLVEALTPFGEQCEIQPERDHIIELIQNVEDAKQTTKCFRHCVLQLFDIMPEGSFFFEEEKIIEVMGMMFPEKEEKSREIVRSCNEKHKEHKEKCDAAHVLSMCMLNLMRSAEYNIPEIKR